MVKSTLKDTAYNYIRKEIITYNLKPGEPIVEQEVSDLLGISRTPIREALKQLSAEGLVHQIPARGTFVYDITLADVEEIFELRVLLETSALRTAITHITEGELDEIQRLLESLNENSDSEEFYKSDSDLHRTILKHSHNSRMMSFYNELESQLERMRRISSKTPKRLSVSRSEHLNILYAIRGRNIADATSKLEYHLKNVKSSIINVCQLMQMDLIMK